MAIQPSVELSRAIRQYQEGQKQAFSQIYNLSLPYLTKCAWNVVSRLCDEDVQDRMQDVLQESFMTISEKLHTLQSVEAYFQWAGQIVTNHALRMWQKDSRLRALEQPEDDLVYELPDERFIPEDILENKEKQLLIRKMLQQLPAGQYFCLVEYFYNGLKETQIAEKLGMPLGTVKTNLSRAKKKLKDIVQTHEKKHGVKLYSMSWLLLLLLLEDVKKMATAGAATGAACLVAEEAVVTGTAAGAASAATAGGTALGTKLIAGILAAVVAIGGTTALLVSRRDDKAPKGQSSSVIQTEAVIEEQPEETKTAVSTDTLNRDVSLSPETLAYMNRIAGSVILPAPATGPAVPYKKDVASYSVNSIIAGCAGTEGLLRGEETADGLVVKKADVEQFVMDVLGWNAPIAEYADPEIIPVGEDAYLIKNYSGDKEAPICIHDIRVAASRWIEIIVPKGYTSYACFFLPDENSPYGWILVNASDAEQREYEEDVMNWVLFEKGIVVPTAGKHSLTAISGSGELTKDAASAYIRLYMKTERDILCAAEVEDYGLIANGYYTYIVFAKNSDGEVLETFVIGTVDGNISIYDPQTHERTWLTWSPTDDPNCA